MLQVNSGYFPLSNTSSTTEVEPSEGVLSLYDDTFADLGTLTSDITINTSNGCMYFNVIFGATLPTITWTNAADLHGLQDIILEANHGYKIRIWDNVVEIISAWEA